MRKELWKVSTFFYQRHSRAYSWDILQFNFKKSLELDLKNLGWTLIYWTWTQKILELPFWTGIDFTIYWSWSWKVLELPCWLWTNFMINRTWTWKKLGLTYWIQIYCIITKQRYCSKSMQTYLNDLLSS